MGDRIVCDKGWAQCWFWVLLLGSESVLPGWWSSLCRRFMTTELLFQRSAFRQVKKVQSKPLLAFVVFKSLQLKIINVTKWRILDDILSASRHIWFWHVLLSFSTNHKHTSRWHFWNIATHWASTLIFFQFTKHSTDVLGSYPITNVKWFSVYAVWRIIWNDFFFLLFKLPC